MKRGVAIITIYLNGKDEEELIQRGRSLCDRINQRDKALSAELEKIYEVPFGKIGEQREIKL